MTHSLRRPATLFAATLALFLAFLVLGAPPAHATSTLDGGTVNASTLVDNEDYELTKSTTIYVDANKAIGSISLGDCHLTFKGDNSHTLYVNAGITAYCPDGFSLGSVSVESGKIHIEMTDNRTTRPAAIYTTIGGFLMAGGDVYISYTNIADSSSAKPAFGIDAATFIVQGGNLSVSCTSSNSEATAIAGKRFEVSGGTVTAYAKTNSSVSTMKYARGIGICNTSSGANDPIMTITGGSVTATGESAGGERGFGIDWILGNSNATAAISGGMVKGIGELHGIRGKALNISGTAYVEVQASKDSALRTEGTLTMSDSGKLKASTSGTDCSAVSVKGYPNLGKHQKMTTPSGGGWGSSGGYRTAVDSYGNNAKTVVIETIIPPSHTVSLACYDLTTHSMITSGNIQVCLNGSSTGVPSYEASIEEGDTYSIDTTGMPTGWTWKGWKLGRTEGGAYLNGGTSPLSFTMGTEDVQYYAIFESPKTVINSLTFTTSYIPSVGDRAYPFNVTVEEEGVTIEGQGRWMDEWGTTLSPDHVFADGETATLYFHYSIGETYVLADDIRDHVTVNGESPSYFSTSTHEVDAQYYLQSERWERLYGDGRYDTMAAIVEEGFDTCDWAVVATGDNFPDALAASALAGSYHCPVILTKSNSLSPQAKAQLERLGVENVFIMGGTGAVSQATEDAIAALGITCSRIAGSDRRDTSVKAMQAVAGVSDTVIIATGQGYADTLSIGPWSYATHSPIILTKADGTLDDSEVAAIKNDERGFTKYILVGGTGVVSDAVKDQLGPDMTCVARLGGADRYETSKLIAEFSLANGLACRWPAIATGANYPDALSGAALCGSNYSVMVLVKDTSSAGIATLAANKASIRHGYVFGGTGAVSQSLMDYVDNATK